VSGASAATDEGRRANPASWPHVALTEACEIITGSTPPRGRAEYYSGDLPWVKPDDLDRGMYVQDSYEHLSSQGASVARVVPAGSVLVSCIGKVGKSAIAARPLATNQQINALIARPEVDPEFLYFAVQVKRDELRKLACSTIVPIVNKSTLASLRIPLPPLPEQKRTAASLREQLDAAARMRAAAATQLELAQLLVRRAHDGLFTSRDLESWPHVALPTVAEIVAGVTLGRRLAVDEARMVPYLRVANVKDGCLADGMRRPASHGVP